MTAVFTTNFAREFAHGKILPMDFNFVSRFQDGRQIVIKVFYGYLFKFHKLKRTMKVLLQFNYTVGVVPSLCSRMKGVFCITVVYLVIGSTSDFLASSI